MVKFTLLFLFLLAFGKLSAKEKQVMLFVTANDQSDTLGYNIAQALPQVLYPFLKSGKINLYESPEKKIKISEASFLSIEKDGNVSFLNCNQFFNYELWNVNLQETTTRLKQIGFSFSMKNKDQQEIYFGFVDYADIDSLLKSTFIPVGLNGNYNTTLHSVLFCHQYFYSVVQYKNRSVVNLMQSEEVKNENKALLNYYKSFASTVPTKKIGYLISHSKNNENAETHLANKFIATMEHFLNENNEIFFNLGGERIIEFINPTHYTITAVEINELWIKENNALKYQFISMRIFVNDRPLDLLLNKQLRKFELIVDFKNVFDFLNEKEFEFKISKINDTSVSVYKSNTYLNALHNYPWNKLEEAIKYEH